MTSRVRAIRLDSGDLLDLSLQCPRRARSGRPPQHPNHRERQPRRVRDRRAIVVGRSPRRIRRWHGHGSLSRRSLPRYRLQAHVLRGRRTGQAVSQQTRPPRSKAGLPPTPTDDRDTGDTIARAEEDLPGRPLLETVMRDGATDHSANLRSFTESRRYAAEQTTRLPETVRGLPEADPPYPVEISAKLNAYHQEVVRRTAARSHETRAGWVE